MGYSSYFRFDDDNKTKYVYSLNHPSYAKGLIHVELVGYKWERPIVRENRHSIEQLIGPIDHNSIVSIKNYCIDVIV